MANKYFIVCILMFMTVIQAGAQLRPKIDRSKPPVVKKKEFPVSESVVLPKKETVSGKKPVNKTYLKISSQSVNFSSGNDSKVFTVSSNKYWNIKISTASWGHLTRNGNKLILKVDANTSTSPRSDYFVIRAGNVEKRVNIYQEGVPLPSKSANVKSVTVSENVDVDNKKGLSVHVTFNIYGMKGNESMVSCYFYDSNGNALVDTNNNYGTNGSVHYVAASKKISPRYDRSIYSDLEIKIPYDELHLSGNYRQNLRVDVLIWDYSVTPNKVLGRKDRVTFTCSPDIAYLKIDGSSSDITKHFGESGGRKHYSVSTGTGLYDIWGVPSWCSIENKTSSGFTLVCERNNDRTSRSDWLKVKSAGKEIRIDIKQSAKSGPTASITKIGQVHNVFSGYVKGMNINLKFNVTGMQGRTVKATAWFYYGDNTTRLNNIYGGHVNVSKSDVAPYENTIFTMTLFVPYQFFNMRRGWSGKLTFDIVISDAYGNSLVRENNRSFTYSQY